MMLISTNNLFELTSFSSLDLIRIMFAALYIIGLALKCKHATNQSADKLI